LVFRGALNYFQDPVKTGNFTLKTGSNNTAVIKLDPIVSSFDFVFDPGQPPSDPVTPLSVNISGIRVRSDLVTDDFQMITGAGANKIMVSDGEGNASWVTPPEGVISPWLVEDENIVTDPNYKNVGIGTEQPKNKLDIHHTDTPGGISITQMLTDEEHGSEILFNKNTDEGIESQFSMGHSIWDGRSSFFIWSFLDEHGKGKAEFYMDLNNGMTGLGTSWPRARLEVDGSFRATAIGIGTDVPSSLSTYKLNVEGGIYARAVKVTSGNFADYVFDDDYKLRSIPDLATYVKENRHLPGIPTAMEVNNDNGIELGGFQVSLLTKIEEQALYIISLQRQIDELRELISLQREEKK